EGRERAARRGEQGPEAAPGGGAARRQEAGCAVSTTEAQERPEEAGAEAWAPARIGRSLIASTPRSTYHWAAARSVAARWTSKGPTSSTWSTSRPPGRT